MQTIILILGASITDETVEHLVNFLGKMTVKTANTYGILCRRVLTQIERLAFAQYVEEISSDYCVWYCDGDIEEIENDKRSYANLRFMN